MASNRKERDGHEARVGELNDIFEELLVDARELVGDLLSGISLTFVMGAVSVILGIQTTWYNRHYIMGGDYIPLFLAGVIVVSGTLIILRGLNLRRKYSRLYEFQRKMSGS